MLAVVEIIGKRVKNMSLKKPLKLGVVSGILSVVCFVVTPWAIGQIATGFPIDETTATKLGEAASASNAAAYVLGFVCVLCIGLSGWSLQKRDQTISEIRLLGDRLEAQTKAFLDGQMKDDHGLEALKEVAASLKDISKRPCALDNDMLLDIIKGKANK